MGIGVAMKGVDFSLVNLPLSPVEDLCFIPISNVSEAFFFRSHFNHFLTFKVNYSILIDFRPL